MHPHFVDHVAPIGEHELAAVRKRLAHLSIALGHPRLTENQVTALIREQTSLKQILASVESSHAEPGHDLGTTSCAGCFVVDDNE